MDNKLNYNELTFQAMVDAVPSALILVNHNGKIAYLNSHAEKLFKYERNEMLGQGVEILIPPRFRERHPEYINLFNSNPRARPMGAGRELFALKSDGTEFPVEIGLNPLATVDGVMVLASIIDITERKKAELRFEAVVESAPNAIVLVNKSGYIALVNREAEKLFGYTRKELVGEKVEKLLPHRFIHNHPSYRGNFFIDPRARPMGAGRDLYALKKDGSEIPVEIGLNPIETLEGNMVLASIIDISERKQREEIEKKHQELEGKNKELEQFAYIASHDLNEPLRTLNNYLELFREDFSPRMSADCHKYLNAMESALLRMNDLIAAILDYSRLGRKVKILKVDLNNLLNEVLADMESSVSLNRVKITSSHLPTLYVHEMEIRQLFQNLISNAIKFRNPQIETKIDISAVHDRSQWKFAVQDNGIGIDPKYFNRIFQIFQRLHPKDKFEGNGIGLANCKKIVELHKGEIWVESSPGNGSTFYFTISQSLEPYEKETTLHHAD